MWMEAFIIDHDTLKLVSVLDGGNYKENNSLSVEYYIIEWESATNGEGGDWMFTYDKENRNLYVPLTVHSETSLPISYDIPILSDRYRIYHFDGNSFIDQGETAHIGLHISLCNYYRLAKYFRTKNYLIRIDRVNRNGDLRYAAWSSKSDESKKPNIVLTGGHYDKDTYFFSNGEYEYIVGFSETVDDSDGRHRHEYLIVKKNDNIILKEERISK